MLEYGTASRRPGGRMQVVRDYDPRPRVAQSRSGGVDPVVERLRAKILAERQGRTPARSTAPVGRTWRPSPADLAAAEADLRERVRRADAMPPGPARNAQVRLCLKLAEARNYLRGES